TADSARRAAPASARTRQFARDRSPLQERKTVCRGGGIPPRRGLPQDIKLERWYSRLVRSSGPDGAQVLSPFSGTMVPFFCRRIPWQVPRLRFVPMVPYESRETSKS